MSAALQDRKLCEGQLRQTTGLLVTGHGGWAGKGWEVQAAGLREQPRQKAIGTEGQAAVGGAASSVPATQSRLQSHSPDSKFYPSPSLSFYRNVSTCSSLASTQHSHASQNAADFHRLRSH